QSTFYIPQSIQTDVKASYSACWSDPGISFGSHYDLLGINYWIETLNNSDTRPEAPHQVSRTLA
ncbi:hypothetical protein ACLBSQ_27745, partial [Klebsiella pneumoniae]